MKRFVLFALIVALAGFSAVPAAQARIVVGIGLGGGFCCGGYGPYYGYPGYYGYPAYYAPPVVYSPPPTVVYTQPATTYVAPAPAAAPVAPPADVSATQASDVFTDDKGRSCRHFQTSLSGAPVTGTACLQADGSWRTVGE